MPREITIGKRKVALTEENCLILKLWQESQQSFFAESDKDSILNDSNVNKLKGYGNKFLNYMHESWEIHLSDTGKYIELDENKLSLDAPAEELYMSFNNFLNETARKMNLTSEMDYDLAENDKLLKEPYAFIKTILLRMTLNVLSNKAEQQATTGKKHLEVLELFVNKLAKVTIFTTTKNWNLCDSGHNPSEFTKTFLDKINDWIKEFEWALEEVSLINLTKNTVEANKQHLQEVQRHVLAYIYMRLKVAIGSKTSKNDFVNDWLPSSLKETEEDIINLNKNVDDSKNEIVQAAGFFVSKERGNTICNIIEQQRKINTEQVKFLKDLYQALYNISFIKKVVDLIDQLTSLTGCLPFLVEYINAEALDKFITSYTKQCLDACNNSGLENTIINAVIRLSGGVPSPKSKILHFSGLANKHTLDKMNDAIQLIFHNLASLCVTQGCIGIINESVFSKIESTTAKLLSLNETEPSSSQDNGEIESCEIQNTLLTNTGKNSLLSCLELERSALMELLNYFQHEENDKENGIWRYVGIEALEVLKDKALPFELNNWLKEKYKEFCVEKYEAPFETMRMLKNAIMEDRQINQNSDILKKANKDILKYLAEQKSSYWTEYYTKIAECKKQLDESYVMLSDVCFTKEFVLAYFQYRYIHKQKDLVYIPSIPTSIKTLAEYYQLEVLISKPGQEEDSVNSCTCENPKKTIRISYEGSIVQSAQTFVLPYAMPSRAKKRVNKLDKTELYQFLFNIKDNRNLPIEAKKDILNFFCTKDKTLASEGINGTLDKLKEAESTIKCFQEGEKNFDSRFLMDAKNYICAKLSKKIEKSIKKYKNYKEIDESLINRLKKLIPHFIDKYFEGKIFETFATLSTELKPQVLVNGQACLLKTEKNPKTDMPKFIAFLDSESHYYRKNEKGEYESFEEENVLGDGNCALYALNIDTRDNLIASLREAIKQKDYRVCLAVDIYNELMNDSSNERKKHDSPEWEKLYDSYMKLQGEIDRHNECFNDYRPDANVSDEDFVKHLETPEIYGLLNESKQADVLYFKKAVEDMRDSYNRLKNYCATPERCEEYIKKLRPDNIWLSRYTLYVYAKWKNFSLSIYDKQRNSKEGFYPKTVVLDMNTICSVSGDKRKESVIFKGANHYDKLKPLEEKWRPENLAEVYLTDLKKRITALAQNCLPQEGKNLEQYKNSLNSNTSIITNCTDEEQLQLKESQNCLIEKESWSMQIKEREIQYNKLNNNKDLVNHIPELEKFKDMLVLVDEPRNSKNWTLLYDAIANGDYTLIEDFLEQGASVVSSNIPNFSVFLEDPITKPYSYRLESKNKHWQLTYCENCEDSPVIIDIHDIVGLKEFLRDLNKGRNYCQDSFYQLIKPYHEKTYPKTPLMLGAKKTGFFSENPLFFTLLSSACKELVLDTERVLQYPTLAHCSRTFIPAIKKVLNYYREVQLARTQNIFYCIRNYILPEQNQARAKELAFAFQAMIEGEKSHNYDELHHRLSCLINGAQKTWNSVLYDGLSVVNNRMDEFLNKNIQQYNEDFKEYMLSSSNNHEFESEPATRMVLKKLERMNRELEEKIEKLQEMEEQRKRERNELEEKYQLDLQHKFEEMERKNQQEKEINDKKLAQDIQRMQEKLLELETLQNEQSEKNKTSEDPIFDCSKEKQVQNIEENVSDEFKLAVSNLVGGKSEAKRFSFLVTYNEPLELCIRFIKSKQFKMEPKEIEYYLIDLYHALMRSLIGIGLDNDLYELKIDIFECKLTIIIQDTITMNRIYSLLKNAGQSYWNESRLSNSKVSFFKPAIEQGKLTIANVIIQQNSVEDNQMGCKIQ